MRGYAQVGIPLVHAPAGGSTLTTPTQNNHNQPLKQPHYHKSFSFSIFFLVFLPKIFHNFSFTKRNYKIILKEKRKLKKIVVNKKRKKKFTFQKKKEKKYLGSCNPKRLWSKKKLFTKSVLNLFPLESKVKNKMKKPNN